MRCARSLFAVCMLTALAGCGDDDSPAAPDATRALAYFDVAAGVGGPVVTDAATLSLVVGPESEAFTIFDVTLTEQDAGTTTAIGSDENPDFGQAVALLTNGENDEIALWRTLVGGGAAITGSLEADAFSGGALSGQEPDFAGAEITGITLELGSVTIRSPGDDRNGDGFWTSAFIEGRIVVMGLP